MAQVGISVAKTEPYGGVINNVNSIKVSRGQYKLKDLKGDERYITITITGPQVPNGYWHGELCMPAEVAKLIGQSLIDVSGNLRSAEIQLEK